MKRILAVIISLIMVMSMVSGCLAVEGNSELTVEMKIGEPVMTVNGSEREIDPGRNTVPVIQNGRTVVPIRAIIEAMGGSVSWDQQTQTSEIEYNGNVVMLTTGSMTGYVNGEEASLDTPPVIMDGRTMLPIRFVAESFGFDTDWDQNTNTVTITGNMDNAEGMTTEISTNNLQTSDAEADKNGNVLVVYYSATGNTEEAANYIAEVTGGNVFELEPKEEYTSSDLNWTDENSRVVYEHNNPGERDTELVTTEVPNWESYDIVFIGYPIWWGIAAWPVDSFVEENDFTGKTVIPFCTSSSSGIGESGKLLSEMAGTGNWLEGMRFGSGVSEEDVSKWIESIDFGGENSSEENSSDGKSLVVYFSMPETTKPDNMTEEEDNSTVVIDGKVLGNTQYMANVIAENKGSDIFRIEPVIPYPTDHDTLVEQAAEEQERNARPEIKDVVENIDDYDVIFVGYPNWWGDMPMILYSFFDEYDLSGKRIITFNTHGGSGFSETAETIRKLEPEASVEEGLSISRDDIQNAEQEIIKWADKIDV